ncbi:hypothetical protein RF11_05849 [Thelohanellus kitauei]|uniref:Uncharacterized protein n=1 Tax=Thelohanellus kitauei TaxID=669202 RepID=A0A0C2M9Z2_THEKT|nr:hypothetical protein RF11_05849 [Thelohanellus kitauei]
MTELIRKIPYKMFRTILMVLIVIQVIIKSYLLFTPYLLTMTASKINCSISNDFRHYGILVFSSDIGSQSIFDKYTFILLPFWFPILLIAYISVIYRILISMASPQNYSDFRSLFGTWTLSCLMSSEVFII